DKGIYNTVNFSSGAYNVVQVDGNVVRYHVDVVNDDARWSNAITNPVSVALVKSKIDGKADWGHTHHWDSIVGKPAFNISLQENAGDKGQYSTINFSSGAYNVVQVDGNVVRYHVDVVNDDARWSNAITNPVSVALVKSKIDGKADWGHTHHWDSITGKPSEFNPSAHSHHWDSISGKPFEFNGNVVSTNFWFNSKHGSVMDGMNYIQNIQSDVVNSVSSSTSELRLNNVESYAKSSAPSGYLTVNSNGKVVFVQQM
ncbi:hypothetical protein, partial [Flectobacillus roseus]|uniref:hypothetical protein n=1 Tax=Flectobacillus roseus TaxID=502259 RepID=UPI0024B65174